MLQVYTRRAQYVFWLNISVSNSFAVEIVDSTQDLEKYPFDLKLWNGFFAHED